MINCRLSLAGYYAGDFLETTILIRIGINKSLLPSCDFFFIFVMYTNKMIIIILIILLKIIIIIINNNNKK